MSAAPLIQEEIERRTTTTTPTRQRPTRKPERVPKGKPKARKRRSANPKAKARPRQGIDGLGVAVFVMCGVSAYLMSGLVGYSAVERSKQSLNRMERQAAEARYDLQRRESLAFLSSAPARLGENARREGFTSPEIQAEDQRNEEAQAQLTTANAGGANQGGTVAEN